MKRLAIGRAPEVSMAFLDTRTILKLCGERRGEERVSGFVFGASEFLCVCAHAFVCVCASMCVCGGTCCDGEMCGDLYDPFRIHSPITDVLHFSFAAEK